MHAIDQALALRPTNFADLKNRALLLRKLGRADEALAALEVALRLRPEDPEILARRARALCELERREEALICAQQALARYADLPMALNARGMILERLGRYEEARADFERMLEIRCDDTDALNNCGMVLARCGRFAESLECYSQSLAIDPQQAQAVYNRSLIRLSLGDWESGLREFESRWTVPPLKASRVKTSAPLWLGKESLRGKTLFLYHEQGYGDTLQCARYVPRLFGLGARVVLAVPPALRKLLQTVKGDPRVIALPGTVPAHDFHCPLMSLPPAFGTTADSVPADAPYLRADPEQVEAWSTRLGRRARPRVGLVWSGRQYSPINYPRDMTLATLQPLFTLEADFISLQKEISDDDRALLAELPMCNHRSADLLEDFADTAALIENLDLVITVDTAVAHLAGALGRPVWLLNRYASCWRWLQAGSESPWYPTMRIFRQSTVGDWTGVVQRVRTAAAEYITQQGCAQLPVSAEADVSARSPKCTALGSHKPTNAEKIRFVCATRGSSDEFFANRPLGRSLPFYRTFPPRQRIELRLFKDNVEGLSSIYNAAIEEARADPAILVFIHDDVYLSDYYWAEHLLDGLRTFDIVGLAGNRRRAPRQASWMYLDDAFRRDRDENLSGVLGHGEGFPNLKELSVYGAPGQSVAMLDGVLLAVRSELLIGTGLRFDERFKFHFYDLDFCRQAENRGLRMGTWAISVIHASPGRLGGEKWRAAYGDYLAKYGEI